MSLKPEHVVPDRLKKKKTKQTLLHTGKLYDHYFFFDVNCVVYFFFFTGSSWMFLANIFAALLVHTQLKILCCTKGFLLLVYNFVFLNILPILAIDVTHINQIFTFEL